MLGIIGGTGLTELSNLEVTHKQVVRTPYGEPSGALVFGRIAGRDVVFLPRHGHAHTIPPHTVNYRANVWALDSLGVSGIVSVASVGGIRRKRLLAAAPSSANIHPRCVGTCSRSSSFRLGRSWGWSSMRRANGPPR